MALMPCAAIATLRTPLWVGAPSVGDLLAIFKDAALKALDQQARSRPRNQRYDQ
jgi:hypothetical protein